MKKNLKMALFVVPMAFAFLTPGTKLSAQTIEEGNIIIEPYYGFPNMWTTIFKAIVETNDGSTYGVTASGIGPFGLRGEYLVSDKFGVGIDFFYANSKVEYTEDTFDGNGNPVTYNYKVSLPRPRFLLRGNLHLGESDVVDPYLGFGLGYSAAQFKFETNDPAFIEDEFTTRNIIPVAYRLAFGTRFFFADFLGAGIEVGIGGPLMTGGLTLKF